MPIKRKKATLLKAASKKKFCSKARASRMPSIVHPMLATLVDEPFSNDDWIFETKWDGFRAVCFVDKTGVRFVSRNQLDMTHQYPELANVGKHVKAREAILDGEIVALDRDGRPRFQLLQPRVGRKRQSDVQALVGRARIVYYVFDLLYLDGFDLTACSVVERKAALEKILRPSTVLKLSEHIIGDGKAFFEQIKRFRLEGMMAKRAAGPYVPRRSTDWLKVKTILRSEAVIGGYTQPRGARSFFGALVVGLYRGNELHYVAHTGGGFNQQSLAKLYKLMQPLKTSESPFVQKPKTNEPVQWLKPKLVAEVKFSEWTDDLHMRHPVFAGLREDKKPKDCRFELEQDADRLV